MGIQTTIDVTRIDAERRYVDKRKYETERTFRSEAALLDDKRLEDALEETFYNYIITK